MQLSMGLVFSPSHRMKLEGPTEFSHPSLLLLLLLLGSRPSKPALGWDRQGNRPRPKSEEGC